MFEYNIELPKTDYKEALSDIISSISAESKALGNIIDSEGELLKKISELSSDIDEIKAANESVSNVIKNVVWLQMLLQLKLEDTEELMRISGNFFEGETCDDFDEYEEYEE